MSDYIMNAFVAGFIYKHYPSISEFMDVKHHPINNNHYSVKNNYAPMQTSPMQWYGTRSREELDDFIQHGWKEGIERAEEIKSEITSEIDMEVMPIPRRRRVFGDHGDEVDMQKVYAGNLDSAWSSCRRTNVVERPIKKVFVSIDATGGTSAEQMFYKGVCGYILTDLLENSGYRVELVGFYGGTGCFVSESRHLYTEVCFKRSDEPFDPNRLIVATALGGFFRYHGFKDILSNPYKALLGLGGAVHSVPSELRNEDDIVLRNVGYKSQVVEEINRIVSSLKKVENQ